MNIEVLKKKEFPFAYLNLLFNQQLRITILGRVKAEACIEVFTFDRGEIRSPRANSGCLHKVLADDDLDSASIRSLELACPLLSSRIV